MRELAIGYFEGPGEVAASMPTQDHLCPVCLSPVGDFDGLLSRSFMVPGSGRSYFIGYHKGCSSEVAAIDAAIEATLFGKAVMQ